MTTKLTLSVEQKVIEKAKLYAQKTGRSLSEIVETYFESLTKDEEYTTSSKLKSLIGVVKLPKNFDEDAARMEYLQKKHL